MKLMTKKTKNKWCVSRPLPPTLMITTQFKSPG